MVVMLIYFQLYGLFKVANGEQVKDGAIYDMKVCSLFHEPWNYVRLLLNYLMANTCKNDIG